MNQKAMTTDPLEGKFQTIIRGEDQQQRFQNYLVDSGVSVDRFTAVVLRAVQEDPALLRADKLSLFLSCQRAAQDALLPDGREGVLVTYRTKDKATEQYISKVQWQPMIGGLRKILARHGFDIRAEVVRENDTEEYGGFFDYQLGDDPFIKHKPPKLGTDRGSTLGAYAIATGPDGRKYMEVMELFELEKVMAISKAGSSGPWTAWRSEMDRKTVCKRLIKALPLYKDDEHLRGVIDRDNEQFDLDAGPQATKGAQKLQKALREEPPLDTTPQRREEQPVQQETAQEEPRQESSIVSTSERVETTENPAPAGDGARPGF